MFVTLPNVQREEGKTSVFSLLLAKKRGTVKKIRLVRKVYIKKKKKKCQIMAFRSVRIQFLQEYNKVQMWF